MDSLPNEVVIQVLELFPTQAVLPLAAISRRFYGLVSRVHYARLVAAISPQDRELILECYHPSAKISTPYMFCDYLGTDGLEQEGQDPSLAGMAKLYSRYRPVIGEENRRPRARYATRSVLNGTEQPIVEQPSHDVHLETTELFSQLCTVINMIKIGPRRGLFLSNINIIDSVIRIRREWLGQESLKVTTDPSGPSILWTDSSENFGLRLRVIEKPDTHAPILVGPGEDPPISYVLEYEELLIRTNQLIRGLEQLEAQQVSNSSNAVIISSM